MRELYARVLAKGGAAVTATTVEATERRLGMTLPKTYRAFTSEVGAAAWPVAVYALDALHRSDGAYGQPPWFVAFATDSFGNEWGWDTRASGDELPIVFWNHGDPPSGTEIETSDEATSFDEWLADEVEQASARDAHERWDHIAKSLEPHRAGVTHVPSAEDVADVEARIGQSLPRDYVSFTLRFGSTAWPFVIVDAQEIESLTSDLHRDHAALRDAIAFGHDVDGMLLAFRGENVVGPSSAVADDFLQLLESRILLVRPVVVREIAPTLVRRRTRSP